MTKSIGNILKKAREKKRLTLDVVYKQTRINPKFIKALESDNYKVFSGKVHSKGFLKLYTKYLGLNTNEMLALWRREYESFFEDDKGEGFFKKREIDPPKLIITPGFVLVVFAALSIIAFFGYLFFQYKNYTGSPNLDIYYPGDNLVVKSDILDITGKTDLDSELYINNQRVILSPDGSFAESVKLKEGLNTISIKSVNKLSKQTELVRTIIYRPDKIEEGKPEEVTETTPSEEILKE